jgi:hypothetical protein
MNKRSSPHPKRSRSWGDNESKEVPHSKASEVQQSWITERNATRGQVEN